MTLHARRLLVGTLLLCSSALSRPAVATESGPAPASSTSTTPHPASRPASAPASQPWNAAAVKDAIARKVDLNHLDAAGDALLHRAAVAGDTESIENLLEHGVRVDLRNAEGLTSLHLAAKAGRLEAVKTLLSHGASLESRASGLTALDLAARENQPKVVSLLLDKGADMRPGLLKTTPLHLAAARGHTEIVRLLLARGADPHWTSLGRTPLDLASKAGNTEVVKLLQDADKGKIPQPIMAFEKFNYRFTPPGGDWLIWKGIAQAVPEANFGLIHKRGEMMMAGIGEAITATSSLNDDVYLSLTNSRLEASAKNIRIIETADYEIHGVKGKRQIEDCVISEIPFRFVIWVHVEHGFAHKLTVWGKASTAAQQRRIVVESETLLNGFELIDPDKTVEPTRGQEVESIRSEVLGYSADLRGLNWQNATAQSLGDTKADVALTNSKTTAFAMRAYPLLQHDPDLELIAKISLKDWNIEYPSAEITNHRLTTENGVQNLRFDFSRMVELNRFWYVFRFAKVGHYAYMIAGWTTLPDAGTHKLLATTIDRVQLDPPVNQTKPADLTQSKRDTVGLLLNEVGLALLKQGHASGAVAYFRSFLELTPDNPTALYNYAFTLKEDSRLTEAAQALEEHEGEFTDQLNLIELKAAIQAELGESAEAIKTYELLFGRGCRSDNAVQQYAKLLNAAGRSDEAVRILEKYVKEGRSVPVVLDLANLHSENGRHEKAIALIKDLAANLPGNQQIVYALADAYYTADRLNEAIGEYDRLIAAGNATTHTWMLKAQVQIKLKQYREAKRSLEQAVARDKTNAEAQKLLAQVEGILGKGSNHLVSNDLDPVATPEWIRQRLKDAGAPPPQDVEDAYYVYRVRLVDFQPQKSCRVTEQWLVKVLTTRGVTQFSSFVLDLNPLFEEICINRLVVRDKNGQVLYTGKLDDYFVLDDTTTNQASHDKLLELPVGGLVPEATIELVTTRRELGKPEQLTYHSEILNAHVPILQSLVWIQGGLDKIAAVEANGPVRQQLEHALAWELLDIPAYRWETLQPPWQEFLPIVWVGPRGSWKQAGSQYLARMAERFSVDPLTRNTASRIVGDEKDPQARVLRLAKYVQTEFTYRGLEFGTRATIPDESAKTILNRYGDCKDFSLLLHQLLAAIDVPSQLALVNSGGEPIESIADLDQFDHMIVYVPGFRGGWFFDCTDKDYNPAVSSPPALAGSRALVLSPDSSRLVPIPDHGLTRDRLKIERTVELDEDGSLQIEETARLDGIRELTFDAALAACSEKNRLETLRAYLSADECGVDLQEYRITRPAATGDPLVIWTKGRTKTRFRKVGDQLIGGLPTVWEHCLLEPTKVDKRKTPFYFKRPLDLHSSTRFKQHEGRSVSNLGDWKLKTGRSDFGEWRLQGQPDAHGDWQIEFEHQAVKGRFGPERYAEFEKWRNDCLDTLTQTIVTQKTQH